METTFKIALPFLRRNGSLNITYEKYQSDFDEVTKMLGELDLDAKVFFRGIFTPRLSEKFSHFRILPKHLHTPWALSKFADWLSIGMKDSPTAMEIEFANRTKPVNPQTYFSVANGLIPSCLEDIRHRQISLCWCVTNNHFWKMLGTVPQDIKDEYFYSYDVFYVSKLTRLNRRFIDAVR